MAEVVYWLGDAGESSAKVCLRADTNGTYVVTCNGVSADVVLDTGVNYGVGAAAFNGLAGNTAYPFTITLAGVLQASGTLRTMPGAADSFYVAFGSCMSTDVDPVVLYRAVRDYDIRAFFSMGDMPYADAGISNRFAAVALTGSYLAPNDIATWHAQYLALQRDIPAYRYMAERVPVYKMWDDHEAVCNDFDHALANVNAQMTAGGGSTFANQAAVDAAFNLARQAWDVWSIGNPASDWPFAANQKPASADAGTSAANYPPQAFSKVLGAAAFHVIDCISHRGNIAQADGGDLIEHASTAKTMLGKPQIKGLKAKLLASTAAFNPIMSGKVTYRGATSSDNRGWSDFVTERAHLLDWIGKHARGVVWGVGDVHTPFVINSERHACVNASPIGQAEQDGTSSPDLGTGYTEGYAWKADGYNDDGWEGTPRCLGLIYITPGYVDWIIIDDKGVELTRWRQYPNANTLVRVS